MYSSSVQEYDWAEHSACAASLNENAVASSILLGGGGAHIFSILGGLLLIRSKTSEIGHFCCFPTDPTQRIWERCFSALESDGGLYIYLQLCKFICTTS